MKKQEYYRQLINIILREQAEDDVPQLPSREEIAKRKLAHKLRLHNQPWVKGIQASGDGYMWELKGRWPITKNMYIDKIYAGDLFEHAIFKPGDPNITKVLTVEVGFLDNPDDRSGYDREGISDDEMLKKLQAVLDDLGFGHVDVKWLGGGSSTWHGKFEFEQSQVSRDIANLVNTLEKKS